MVPSTLELLLEISLIIVVAKVAGDLAEKAGLSAVLGELLAGVVLGPTLFGLHLDNEVIAFLAEVGIVLLLLEVGLTTDPAEVRRVGVRALLVAAVGVAVSFVLGTLAMVLLGHPGLPALLMGAALASTSMGISVRVLADLGKLETPEAKLIVASALFDDIMGLVLLSILTGVAVHGAVEPLAILWVVLLSVLFVAIPLTVGRALGERILRIASRIQVRGILTAVAFVTALVLAAVADYIGLAPILGGFAAGLIFAATGQREHIEARMKPLADLFVPVFFVLVGSRADLRSLGDAHIALLAAVLLGAAVVGKLAAGLGSLGTGVRPLRVGAGLIPRGEVTLIVATLAAVEVVPPPWDVGLYGAVLVVVVLTALLTPPLMRLVFRPSEEEGQIRRREPRVTPGENVPFEEPGPNSRDK